MRYLLFLLVFTSMLAGALSVSGGNVSQIFLSQLLGNTTRWAGLVGVVNPAGGSITDNFSSNNVSSISFYFPGYCAGGSNFVFASNSSSVNWDQLSKMTSVELDSHLGLYGNESDSANRTFTSNIDYSFGSQSFSEVNATYTLSGSLSPGFDLGLFKDASSGAVIFATGVSEGALAYDNSTPVDFQFLLPIPSGESNESYYFYGASYSCPTPPPSPSVGNVSGGDDYSGDVYYPYYSGSSGYAATPSTAAGETEARPSVGGPFPSGALFPVSTPSPDAHFGISGAGLSIAGGQCWSIECLLVNYWLLLLLLLLLFVTILAWWMTTA